MQENYFDETNKKSGTTVSSSYIKKNLYKNIRINRTRPRSMDIPPPVSAGITIEGQCLTGLYFSVFFFSFLN